MSFLLVSVACFVTNSLRPTHKNYKILTLLSLWSLPIAPDSAKEETPPVSWLLPIVCPCILAALCPSITELFTVLHIPVPIPLLLLGCNLPLWISLGNINLIRYTLFSTFFFSAPLLGMLLAGFIIRNVPILYELVHIPTTWSSTLRNTALTIILIRAGLGLDPQVSFLFNFE